MPTPADRAKAQAIYLQALHDAAKKEYEQDPTKYPIDLQGRVILDVKFDDAAWRAIYNLNQVNTKEEFKTKLGHPVQETTSVSLDLQATQTETTRQALHSALRNNLTENKEAILKAYQGLAKGRIISLQQETHFHAHLIGRMLKAAIDKAQGLGETDTKFQEGLENALVILNTRIIKLQAKALEKAFAKANTTGVLDQEKFALTLNEELDKARKILLPSIAKTIREELIKTTEIQFTKEITQHLSKHLAEATSGSANDFVHSDKGTGFISFIGANERTSHHQQLGGDHVADRIMYSHHLKEDGVIVPLSHRQQVRVPSIAIKKLHPVTAKLLKQDVKKKSEIQGQTDDLITSRIQALDPKNKLSEEEQQQILKEYQEINTILVTNQGTAYTDELIKSAFNTLVVDDAAEKIAHLQNKYTLGGDTRVIDADELPAAFVYNLYTTLNKGFAGGIDESANLQSQSAEHILTSAHQYNRDNSTKPLCLVQNMAVNGWGHELSISDENPPLVNEAALMAQMATLHTIYDCLHSFDQRVVKERLFGAYTKFLTTPQTSFYDYLKGTHSEVLIQLERMRKQLDVHPANVPEEKDHRDQFTHHAKTALATLFKEGAFSHRENGFTYQALSVFVEKSSIGGCKSANERAQAVNGRVSILDFISLDKITRNKLLRDYLSKEEAKRLITLSDDLEASIASRNTAEITRPMDALYQSLNLEGFQAVISFIDQGGHAKLGTKSGLIPNTNNAETVKTHVKHASDWQCHKGLTDNVLKEFSGIQKVSYGKELTKTAKFLGLATVGGVIGGSGAFGIAAAIGVSAAFPPIGIAIGLAVAAATALVALVSLGSFLGKLWNSNRSKTEARFKAIQKDNEEIVKGSNQNREPAGSHQMDALQGADSSETRNPRRARSSSVADSVQPPAFVRRRSEGDLNHIKQVLSAESTPISSPDSVQSSHHLKDELKSEKGSDEERSSSDEPPENLSPSPDLTPRN